MASSILLLHLYSQDNQNDMKHDSFGHVMHLVLASASYDADGIVNGTISFV